MIKDNYLYSLFNANKNIFLTCPECDEELTGQDIENFARCPFCNHKFKRDGEFEEFIMQPVIQLWMEEHGQ